MRLNLPHLGIGRRHNPVVSRETWRARTVHRPLPTQTARMWIDISVTLLDYARQRRGAAVEDIAVRSYSSR